MLCPVVVLYGLGYFYDPAAGKSFVKTGLISVATMPPGATIVLKGRRLEEKTPAQIRGLLPGNYALTLELEGHRPWSALVPVEVERATVLENVLLLKTDPPTEKVLPGGFTGLVPLDGPFFLLSRGDRAQDLWVFNWKTGGIRRFLPEASGLGPSKVVSVFTSRGSARALVWLRTRADDADAFFWAGISSAETELTDVTKLFPERPGRVEWDAADEDVLVVGRAGSLDRVRLSTASVNPKFVENARGFGVGDGKIWVLGGDRVLRQFDEENVPGETVTDDPFLAPLFGEDAFYRVRPLTKGRALFWGSDGSLLINRFPYGLVEADVRGVALDASGGKALVWTRDRIGVIDLATPVDPRLRWIYKSGRRIREAWWVYDGSHVLFRDGERLLLLEASGRARPHLNELVRPARRGPAVFYSDDTGEAFYLGAAGELLRTRIWNRPALLALPGRDGEAPAEKREAADAGV